jgi:hypothetical protein
MKSETYFYMQIKHTLQDMFGDKYIIKDLNQVKQRQVFLILMSVMMDMSYG